MLSRRDRGLGGKDAVDKTPFSDCGWVIRMARGCLNPSIARDEHIVTVSP